jgi:CelD/BcsL family acetyltransferase involved in cellulose biosynthesis
VADDEAALAEALGRAGELSRSACRERAQRFDLRRTTERYLQLYSELARDAAPPCRAPAPSARGAPSEGVEIVTSLARLRAIEPQLLDLFQRDPAATPFQSPHWLLPWVEHLGTPTALRWVVAFRHGRAVASLPLMRSEEAGASTLRWIGSGCTDRHDLLLDARERADAIERLRGALRELSVEVDRVELDELPEQALSRELFGQREGSRIEPGSVCPVLELGRALGDIEAALPRWLRRNLRQTERRLARLGDVEWRLAQPHDAAALLDVFSGLHAARWQARGLPGVLAEPAVLAFHRAAAPRLVESGALELEVGFLEERPLAATYVLRRAHAHLYLFGFDPSWPTLSLGSLAIWRSIGRAASAGLARYDFLRGCEPYKYAFGAQNQQSYRCVAPGRAQPRA